MFRVLWWSWGGGAVSYERGTPVHHERVDEGHDSGLHFLETFFVFCLRAFKSRLSDLSVLDTSKTRTWKCRTHTSYSTKVLLGDRTADCTSLKSAGRPSVRPACVETKIDTQFGFTSDMITFVIGWDNCLNTKASIWPRLSCVCHIRSTAAFECGCTMSIWRRRIAVSNPMKITVRLL